MLLQHLQYEQALQLRRTQALSAAQPITITIPSVQMDTIIQPSNPVRFKHDSPSVDSAYPVRSRLRIRTAHLLRLPNREMPSSVPHSAAPGQGLSANMESLCRLQFSSHPGR